MYVRFVIFSALMAVMAWAAPFGLAQDPPAAARPANRVSHAASAVPAGTPFVIVGVVLSGDGGVEQWRVVPDSTRAVPSMAAFQHFSMPATAAELTALLAPLADAHRNDDKFTTELTLAVVIPPDSRGNAFLHALMFGADPKLGIYRYVLLFDSGDGAFLGHQTQLPVDRGLRMAPAQPRPTLTITLSAHPAGTAITFTGLPDPMILLRDDAADGHERALAELTNRLRRHRAQISRAVRLSIGSEVSPRIVEATLRALNTANDGIDPDQQLHVIFAAPLQQHPPRPLRTLTAGRGQGRDAWRDGVPMPMPEQPRIRRQVIPEEPLPDPFERPTDPPRIEENAEDNRNEDPTETPDSGLRPNRGEDPNAESPLPRQGFNPGIGLGDPQATQNRPIQRPAAFRQRDEGANRGDTNVTAALKWLRDHQRPDGGWSAKNFAADGRRNGRQGESKNLDGSADAGWENADVGVTGLALLAFLGAGYTHQEGEFSTTVRNALRFLRATQDNDGCFGDRADPHFIYGHAIATLAMVEAYGLTSASILKRTSQEAVNFIVTAQNIDPDRGSLGWRYGVRPGDNDTNITGWMVMALWTAKTAGLDVPQEALAGAKRHFADMTDPRTHITGYITRGGSNARLAMQARFSPNPTMDAVHVFAGSLLGQSRHTATFRAQAARMVESANLPTLTDPNARDFYYWYVGTLAMFQIGGDQWKRWHDAVMPALIESQRLDGGENSATYGSWDTISAWGPAGGRVYTTAINCLTLQTAYRYQRIEPLPSENPPAGGNDGGNDGR